MFFTIMELEIKLRENKMAITEIEDKISEIIDKNDHDNFIYDFLSVYNIPRATITKLRKGINNLSNEEGEVYLKNKLYYKQTNGKLMQAFTDIKEKVDALGSKPRYIFITDFKDVLAYDTKTSDTLSVSFKRLPQKFEFFLAWNGIEKVDFDKENPADVRAAERFAKLYDVITKDNPKATKKGLNLFFIRILFCLFAEDTDIFSKNLFTNRVKELTKIDGSDLDDFIKQLFGVLDVSIKDRPKDTPSWLQDFPYVDGDLFKDSHESLKFTAKSRKLIIDAGEKLEWDQINPDILGSMMQAVANEDSRSHLGMHYTSVPNIMKVIKPLFLDDLRDEFEKAKGNYKKLDMLYERIGKIKFMDPACGSGNFLIVTYKQLRQLEIDIIKEQNKIVAKEGTGKATMYLPSVTLDQFYGIEIDDFACDTTRLSLWIAEHQMNIKLRKEIDNAVRPTLPLHHAGAIVCGNALRLNWDEILPHKKDDEVYLFGNPPYLGANSQDEDQKEDLKYTFPKSVNTGEFDYICGWFYKATLFLENCNGISQFSFVTTNSLTEGKLIGLFWPILLERGAHITSAHHNFKWNNNAKGQAQVTVEIIQISLTDIKEKRLFNNLGEQIVENINPYLTTGSNIIVKRHKGLPLFNLPVMYSGDRPTDGKGNLKFSIYQYNQIIKKYPNIKKYFRRLIGGNELLNNTFNYVLWINNKNENNYLQQYPEIKRRIHNVEIARKNIPKLQKEPWRFRDTRQPVNSMIILPATSSENRLYIPVSIVDNRYIVNNSTFVIYDGPLWVAGIIQSHIHMLWTNKIGGKLETRLRYSKDLSYNTFPLPELSTRRKNEIEQLMLNILDIREEEGGSLAELYGSPLAEKNPKPMNERLLKAHQELDEVVDRAYKPNGFKDDNERLSLLLNMYSKKVDEIENEQKK